MDLTPDEEVRRGGRKEIKQNEGCGVRTRKLLGVTKIVVFTFRCPCKLLTRLSYELWTFLHRSFMISKLWAFLVVL